MQIKGSVQGFLLKDFVRKDHKVEVLSLREGRLFPRACVSLDSGDRVQDVPFLQTVWRWLSTVWLPRSLIWVPPVPAKALNSLHLVSPHTD